MCLASATTLLPTLRAALPVLKTVSLPSNVSGRQLHGLTAEIDPLGTEPAERAVEAEIAHRTEPTWLDLKPIAVIAPAALVAPRR
jgi:hypothetical protein